MTKTWTEVMEKGMRKYPLQVFGYCRNRSGAEWDSGGTLRAREIQRDEFARGACAWYTLWAAMEKDELYDRMGIAPCDCERYVSGIVALGDIVIHLNDWHRWDRLEIAEWLDREYPRCPVIEEARHGEVEEPKEEAAELVTA